MLYQLSYSRKSPLLRGQAPLTRRKWWVEKDSNLRKLALAGLQPAPIGHSGIHP